MREQRARRQPEELGSTYGGSGRHRLPAIHRRNRLDVTSYFQLNGWSTGSGTYYITVKEFTRSVTIIFVSAAIFGTGIGQLLAEFLRG